MVLLRVSTFVCDLDNRILTHQHAARVTFRFRDEMRVDNASGRIQLQEIAAFQRPHELDDRTVEQSHLACHLFLPYAFHRSCPCIPPFTGLVHSFPLVKEDVNTLQITGNIPVTV